MRCICWLTQKYALLDRGYEMFQLDFRSLQNLWQTQVCDIYKEVRVSRCVSVFSVMMFNVPDGLIWPQLPL